MFRLLQRVLSWLCLFLLVSSLESGFCFSVVSFVWFLVQVVLILLVRVFCLVGSRVFRFLLLIFFQSVWVLFRLVFRLVSEVLLCQVLVWQGWGMFLFCWFSGVLSFFFSMFRVVIWICSSLVIVLWVLVQWLLGNLFIWVSMLLLFFQCVRMFWVSCCWWVLMVFSNG